MDKALQLILEESLVEFYIVDIRTLKFVFANKAACDNLGYTLEELRAMTPLQTSPHFSADSLQELMKPLRETAGQRAMMVTNTHRRKDGSTYNVDVHVQLGEYRGHSVFFGYAFDATERERELDQLRQVIRGAQLGYWDFNYATGEYFVDDNWLGMLGITRDDLGELPEGWQNFVHPDDLEELDARLMKIRAKPQSYTVEFRMVHKDGHPVWIRSSGAVVAWNHEQNRPLRICGTHLDITERKLNEQAKDQFLRFFQISTDIMVISDPFGAFQKVNPATQKILGYREDELLAKPFIDFIYKEDKQRTIEEMERQVQVGSSMNFENRYVCKDGSLRWLSWTATHDRDEGVTYATARDVTEQRQVEDQLRRQVDITRALIENSQDMIVMYDRDHRYVYVNPALERVMGITRDEFVGKSRKDFDFPEELRRLWHATIEQVFDTGLPQSRYYELDTYSGRLNIDWNVFPGIRNGAGEVTSVFGVSRDVTASKKAEAELQKMQRLHSIGMLAGGIAHDFNNILTILFGNISMAKDFLENPEISRKSLENAEKAFHRASSLTSQLLTFAKGGNPVKQDVSLKSLVRDTVSFDLSGSNVKLELEVPDDLWIALADKGQMAQVFSNLAINADQAMPNGGILAITLENIPVGKEEVPGLEPGRYIRATVRDEGVGIPGAELDHIFDPFYSTKQSGSGLGLATVYSVVSKHGGHINVRSTPGKGTTFTLYLPASDRVHSDSPPEQPAVRPSPGESGRVLVMDDEPMICELAVNILQDEGFQVDTAGNGAEAVALYRESLVTRQPYDCLVMDLTIPGGIGGEDVVKEILALNPQARVVVSSGYAVDPVMANFADYGFTGVITKPFTRQALMTEVRRQVG